MVLCSGEEEEEFCAKTERERAPPGTIDLFAEKTKKPQSRNMLPIYTKHVRDILKTGGCYGRRTSQVAEKRKHGRRDVSYAHVSTVHYGDRYRPVGRSCLYRIAIWPQRGFPCCSICNDGALSNNGAVAAAPADQRFVAISAIFHDSIDRVRWPSNVACKGRGKCACYTTPFACQHLQEQRKLHGRSASAQSASHTNACTCRWNVVAAASPASTPRRTD